jgi:hypothetical protein
LGLSSGLQVWLGLRRVGGGFDCGCIAALTITALARATPPAATPRALSIGALVSAIGWGNLHEFRFSLLGKKLALTLSLVTTATTARTPALAATLAAILRGPIVFARLALAFLGLSGGTSITDFLRLSGLRSLAILGAVSIFRPVAVLGTISATTITSIATTISLSTTASRVRA